MIKHHLLVGQLNCGKSAQVMAEVRQLVDSKEVDILCLQDPYSMPARGTLLNVPLTARTIHQEHGLASIVMYNPEILILKVTQGCDRTMATVDRASTESGSKVEFLAFGRLKWIATDRLPA